MLKDLPSTSKIRGTYHQRNTMLVGDLGNCFEIWHVVAGIANAFDIDSLGVLVDLRGDIFGLFTIDELGLDTQPGEEDLELIVRAAVQVGS